MNQNKDEDIARNESSKTPRSLAVVLLTGLIAIGALASLISARITQAMAQQSIEVESTVTLAVCNSIFFAMLWLYRSKKAWSGAIIGCVTGFIVALAVNFAL